MPEGSSYLAQNSTDLSAAISPGSLYLISFCKILSHLLLEFGFPGFSQCLPVADCVFFLRESGFHFFSGLSSPLLFLSFPQAISGRWYTTRGIWKMWKAMFWWFPFCGGAYLRPGRKHWSSSFHPQQFAFSWGLCSFHMNSGETFHWFGVFFLSFLFFIFPFLFFFFFFFN